MQLCIISVLCVCSGFVYAQTPSIGEECLKLEFTNPRISSIYYNEERPGFCISINNPENSEYNAVLTVAVCNINGIQVWASESTDIFLKAKTVHYKGVKPEINKYGVYTIMVTLSGNFGELCESKAFSVVKGNDKVSDEIGVCTHFDISSYNEKTDETKSLTSNGGFGWVRDDLRWDKVETEKGEYVISQTRAEQIDAILENGNKLILILGYSNALYDGDGIFPKTSDAVDAYAAYCAMMAKRYKGRIDTFEIWNEPDHNWNIKGSDYAALLKKAYNAIKNENKNATVIAGAVTTLSQNGSKTFLDEMFSDPEIVNYMDALSFHPYSNNKAYSDESTECTFLQNVKVAQDKLEEAQKALADKNGTDVPTEKIPIWITEYGTSSRVSEEWNYTETGQASNIVRTMIAAKSVPQIERVFIYNIREKGNDIEDMEQNFGIVNNDYTAKPVYVALSFMNGILNGAQHKERWTDVGYNGRNFSAHKFENGNENESLKNDIFVLWAHSDKTAVVNVNRTGAAGDAVKYTEDGDNPVITAACDSIIEYYDMYGNSIEVTDGVYSLTNEPIYIVCGFERKTEITRDGNTVTVSGFSRQADSDVTLLAVDKNGVGNKILAIEQKKSGANGEFEFVFSVSQSKAYYLYVFDGDIRQEYDYGEADFEVDIQYYVNNWLVDSLDRLNDNDIVNVKMNITDRKNAFDRLILWGVVYKENMMLKAVDYEDVVWTSEDSGNAELTFEIDDESEVRKLQFFIWDENMKPAAGIDVINR